MIAEALTRRATPSSASAAVSASTVQALTGTERLLWEASERALRQKREHVVLVLHLSRIASLAPRPHHLRVARVLLQDAAWHFGGQVFAMRNQDLVLLCAQASAVAAPVSRQADAVPAPDALPVTLAKLFAADVPDPARLTSLWRLAAGAPSLLAYLAVLAREPGPDEPRPDKPGPGEAPEQPAEAALSVAALQGILSQAPIADLMVQRIGMSLGPDRGRSLADRLRPAFRELELSFASLALAPLLRQATRDPFLVRHLAGDFDSRLLSLLADDLANNGRLTAPSLRTGLPIHIELGLDAILSPGFARLSREADRRGVRFGACLSVMQACADFDLMSHACGVLRLTGAELVLSGVEAACLGMITPASLQPDLMKLVWSPGLLNDGVATHLRAASLAGFDPARVVLQGIDSPQALAWGQAHGIGLFAGPFLDQVQAATRMAGCHSAAGCTIRQCCDRGAALGVPGRAGCSNPARLDLPAGAVPF